MAKGALFISALYTYDPAGRLKQQSDALGRKMNYAYTMDDLLDRVTKGEPGPGEMEVVKREYDGAGRVTLERVGGRQTVTYYYDGDGKLVDSTVDPGGVTPTPLPRSATGLALDWTVRG
ncbi:YD repeat-containing protein [Saccharopolyspora shandongensis]|uniref:YD repeat-containing protein n=1 Tax=Saccharopolyspora shandongensis TaxID=418495 RepID=A0A1H3TX22_9PSEU|nr:hypothetical protein [Saccharopolyspora shandongensis]SDZ54662.1 YD repeat-containing protein [Saccharopolyspora shandongensis]